MLHPRIPRRLTAWLALLAMVLGTLAPTLAQAVAVSSDQRGWVQVCSASGMFWIQADAHPASPAESQAETSAICPWCSLHGGAAGMPPVAELVVSAPDAAAQAPTPQLPGLRRRAWTPAQARAPPLEA